MGIQRYRVEFKDILERTLLPEGISNEEMKEKLLPLMKHVCEHIPSRFFRYRGCTELSIDAFDKDILFASTSDQFNDPYDCLFRYDKKGLRQSILQSLSKEYIFILREFLRFGNKFPDELNSFYTKDFLAYAIASIRDASDDEIQNSEGFYSEFRKKFSENYDKRIDKAVEAVKRNAYIACFSETINSVTMWSHYANNHKGFALEYDYIPLQMQCQKCEKFKQCEKAIINNIYPVIYDKNRYEATNYLVSSILKMMGLPVNNPDTLTVTKCQLYKSTQWSYEKEWRLIITLRNDCIKPKEDYFGIMNVRPKAIYYGTRISPINKKMLHLIAKEKGISEYQMYIDDKSYNYSVKYKKV